LLIIRHDQLLHRRHRVLQSAGGILVEQLLPALPP
jgi:hypothetical protein